MGGNRLHDRTSLSIPFDSDHSYGTTPAPRPSTSSHLRGSPRLAGSRSILTMRHFTSLADWSPADLRHLLDVAKRLKQQYRSTGRNDPVLAGQTLAMVFEKPSLRTRVSFAVAMTHLGGVGLLLRDDEGRPRQAGARAGRGPGAQRHVRRHHGPHVLAPGPARPGQARHRAGHQRTHRLQPPVPGHGRPDDRRGALRLPGRPARGVRRGRQQRRPQPGRRLRQARP